MKSADITVGETYLYQSRSYSPTSIVEVLRVVSKSERAMIKNPNLPPVRAKYATDTDTVEVKVVAHRGWREDAVPFEEVTDERVLWVRPQTILRAAKIEEENEKIAEAARVKAEHAQSLRDLAARFEDKLGHTGLPLPVVRESFRSGMHYIEYPRWTEEDYDRLVELLP